MLKFLHSLFKPTPPLAPAVEIECPRVGDSAPTNAVLIIGNRNWPNPDSETLYSIAENGVVIWVGDIMEFKRLLRDAARLDSGARC